ncbi:MAG: FAD-binding protein [Solirubrobacteraceae bacterium]
MLRTTPWVPVGPVFPSYYWALRQLERRFQTGRVRVRAHRGLIISTGGFSWNPDMMREHAPDIRKTMPIGFDANGSGILLGQTVGAATDHLENVGTFRMFVPPLAFGRGMLVDANGQRSANELWYTGRVGGAMRQRTNGRGYLILDQALVEQAKTEIPDLALFLGLPARIWLTRAVKAPTLSALAAKLEMPSGSLDASAERIAEIAQGASDPYGRAAKDTHPLTRGPFYALDMSLNAQPLPATRLSRGGLVVDEDTGGVLDQDRQPIRGLYAAGMTTASTST